MLYSMGGQGHRLPVHRHLLGPVIHSDGADGQQAGALLRPPREVYRRSWLFTRAMTSRG